MKLAIFDFDGTLFPLQTIPFLIKQYPKLGYSRLRQWQLYYRLIPMMFKYKVIKSIDKEEFRRDAVYVFLGLFDGLSEERVQAFFEKNAKIVYDLLDAKIVDEAIRLKKEGYHTLLLSGCFDMMLNPLGQRIGFDQVIATKLLFEEKANGSKNFSSSTPIKVIAGKNKPDAAKKMAIADQIDWESSVAYADSYYDRDVLELVGHKICVNPDDRLKEICEDNGWTMLLT